MATLSSKAHEKLRELHEEEERMKLRMLQADAGLIGGKDLLVTAERMDWMYHNPAQAKKENEDYLLGKVITTPDEKEEMRKRLGADNKAAGSLFLSSVTQQNDDTIRRLREDPLFIIRQAEHRQRKMDCTRQRIFASVAASGSSSISASNDHVSRPTQSKSGKKQKISKNTSPPSHKHKSKHRLFQHSMSPAHSFKSTRDQHFSSDSSREKKKLFDRLSPTRLPRYNDTSSFKDDTFSHLQPPHDSPNQRFSKRTRDPDSIQFARHSNYKYSLTPSSLNEYESKDRHIMPKKRVYNMKSRVSRSISRSHGSVSEYQARHDNKSYPTSNDTSQFKSTFQNQHNKEYRHHSSSLYGKTTSLSNSSEVIYRNRTHRHSRYDCQKSTYLFKNGRYDDSLRRTQYHTSSFRSQESIMSPESYRNNCTVSDTRDDCLNRLIAHRSSSLSNSSNRLSIMKRRTLLPDIKQSLSKKKLTLNNKNELQDVHLYSTPTVANTHTDDRDTQRSTNQQSDPSHLHNKLTQTVSAQSIVKGPMIPSNWKNQMNLQTISDDSDHSNEDDSDLGPPEEMEESFRIMRETKKTLPSLWKMSKNNSLPESSNPMIKSSTKSLINPEQKDHPLLIMTQVQQDDLLQQMIIEGERHEKDKLKKLHCVETIEALQEQLESQKRTTNLDTESTAAFLNETKKAAYVNNSLSLEDRIKRYAARRQKTLLERNELEDQTK